MNQLMNNSERIVDILMGLLRGGTIDLDSYKSLYGRDYRTYRRDMKAIENNADFLAEYSMKYNSASKKNFVTKNGLINSEKILIVLEVLMASRAISKDELEELINQLLDLVSTSDRSKVKKLITPTIENYRPALDQPIFPMVKDFADWVVSKREITFKYADFSKRMIGVPLSIYFDSCHFYVMIYLVDEDKTTLYYLDQIKEAKAKRKVVNVPANKRIDVGKNINGNTALNKGNHIHYKFDYQSNKQTALNNVPNSYVSEDDDPNNPNETIVEGDLFSEGALLWVLSQESHVKVLEPQSLIDKLRKELKKNLEFYPDEK